MFDFLKPGKGYALTFSNGRRVEVDFGPMSHSEKINSSQKECDHSPASRDAEVRVYEPGKAGNPSFTLYNITPDELPELLAKAANA